MIWSIDWWLVVVVGDKRCPRLLRQVGQTSVRMRRGHHNQCGLLDLIQLLSPRLMRANFRHHLATVLTAHQQQAGLGPYFCGDISRVCISFRNVDFVLCLENVIWLFSFQPPTHTDRLIGLGFLPSLKRNQLMSILLDKQAVNVKELSTLCRVKEWYTLRLRVKWRNN